MNADEAEERKAQRYAPKRKRPAKHAALSFASRLRACALKIKGTTRREWMVEEIFIEGAN